MWNAAGSENALKPRLFVVKRLPNEARGVPDVLRGDFPAARGRTSAAWGRPRTVWGRTSAAWGRPRTAWGGASAPWGRPHAARDGSAKAISASPCGTGMSPWRGKFTSCGMGNAPCGAGKLMRASRGRVRQRKERASTFPKRRCLDGTLRRSDAPTLRRSDAPTLRRSVRGVSDE